LGAAYLAGISAGIFRDEKRIAAHWTLERRFAPAMQRGERDRLYAGWQAAVARVRTG
jgi:glycerol kinase